jgi:nitroimidazol reductase NimA-like FMN-containing flavoprotein (pyridoxamine 5'-phosphate oxidase superfamily)
MPVTVDRPYMPGYGIETSPVGLLEWEWADQRLRRSRAYWVATSDGLGRPHLAAVWGVWDGSSLWFSTGGRSRKARNLGVNDSLVVATESTIESVVVHGRAEQVDSAGMLDRLLPAYVDKYGSAFPDPAENPIYRVRPAKVIATIESEADFTRHATRWTLSP